MRICSESFLRGLHNGSKNNILLNVHAQKDLIWYWNYIIYNMLNFTLYVYSSKYENNHKCVLTLHTYLER